MFTGLVQSLATVSRIEPDGHGGVQLEITEPTLAPLMVLGESVSVNGTCLTVVNSSSTTFAFQCGPETLDRTNLGRLTVGNRVNLERALRVGDAIGGHFVSGHVDFVGKIVEKIPNGEWHTIWFEVPVEFDDLFVTKGSIAIDGISLTLVDVQPGRVSVMLIPHTMATTTLGFKGVGSEVNMECDMLAKHVRKLFKNLTLEL